MESLGLNRLYSQSQRVYKRSYGFYERVFCHDNMVFCLLLEAEHEEEVYFKIQQLFQIDCLKLVFHNVILGDLREGFDFLGWSFRVKTTGQLIVDFNHRYWRSCKREIKDILQNTELSFIPKLYRIHCLILYWKNYGQFCDNSQIHNKLLQLKELCNAYIRRKTKLSKLERLTVIRYIC